LNTVLIAAGMAIAARFSPAPAPVERGRSAPMDVTPWRGLRPATAILAAVAIAIYVALWSFTAG